MKRFNIVIYYYMRGSMTRKTKKNKKKNFKKLLVNLVD